MGATAHGGDSDNVRPIDEAGEAEPFRRAKAVRALGRHADPEALDQLFALLSDPEWLVVKAALQSLRRYRDPRIVPAIQAVLGRRDFFAWLTPRSGAISTAATRALRSQGEAGFQALLTMLHEFQDDEVWGQAVERQLTVLRDPRAIEPLIACFSSPVFEVANKAAAMMRHFGGDAIPPLIAAMSITDQSVYFHVAWALRWIGSPAVPALLDALRHATDENIRSGAADVLGRVDSEEVREALYAALDDEAADVRSMATWSLGELGDPRVLHQLLVEQPSQRPGSLEPASTIANIGSMAVSPLIVALEDRERPAYQRVNAARALGRIEDERTVEPLITALRDDDEAVRVAAIFALSDLKYAVTVKPLLSALAVEPLLAASHDPSFEVRRWAIDQLAAIDAERAFNEVVRYVRESGEGEEGYKSTSGILRTLAQHHGERVLPLLREKALSDDFRELPGVLATLSQLGVPAVPVLLEVARDPRPERRHSAITWLEFAYRHSPDARIVEFLFKVIQENPTSSVAEGMRYLAALALAECGDPRAVEPLLEILQSERALGHSMRSSAVWPLGELGDERVLEALTAAYEASMAGEDGGDVSERPGRQYEFQDALLRARAKIRARLDKTRDDAGSSGASAET